MRLFIVTFFCSLLSICNLEIVSNENHIWRVNNDGMIPVENIYPMPRYQNFPDKNALADLRNGPTQSCLNQDHSEDKQLEHTIVHPPTRRSSNSEKQKSSLPNSESNNVQNHVVKFDDNEIRWVSHENALPSPQSLNIGNRVTKTLDNFQENNLISREGFVLDNIDEDAPLPFGDSVSQENSMSRNQENVATTAVDESESSDFIEQETGFINPRLDTVKSSTTDKKVVGCTNKNEFDSLPKLPRRFLPATINTLSPDQRTLNRNSELGKKNNDNDYLYSNTNNNAGNQVQTQKNAVLILNNTSSSNSKKLNKFSQSIEGHSAGRSGNTYMLNNPKFNDPTRGAGISYIDKNTRNNLMSFRVCYACSSSNNPTCLSPDRKTTVKYCRKGVNACVTKTFGTGSSLTLIRDCGKTCDDSEIPGLVPKYKTCSICHRDLCNGSYSINISRSILALPTIVLIVLIGPLSIFS